MTASVPMKCTRPTGVPKDHEGFNFQGSGERPCSSIILALTLGATEIWWAALSGLLHSGKAGSVKWHYVMDLAPPSTTVLFISNQPDRLPYHPPTIFLVARCGGRWSSKNVQARCRSIVGKSSGEGGEVRLSISILGTLRTVNTTQSPLERTAATWSHGQLDATACINQQGAADQ